MPKLFLGKSQEWNGIGVIESEPEKTVMKNGAWFMMVNLTCRTRRGTFVTLRCMFLDDLASTFERQFRIGDIVYISGEVDEYRAGRGYDNFQIKNIINVLDYAFITDYRGQAEPLSQDKAEWLQACSDLFDKNAPMPTEDDAKHFQAIRDERAKQNIERRKVAGLPPPKK